MRSSSENKRMLEILEYCYSKTDNEFLNILLLDIDCDISSEGPISCVSMYYEWLKIKQIMKTKTLVEKIIFFLEIFQNDYGFELENVIELLETEKEALNAGYTEDGSVSEEFDN